MKQQPDKQQSSPNGKKQDLQGEGNYDAARQFDREQEAFAADSERVKRKAREAADALDGKEGDELRAAEEKTDRVRPGGERG